ncbi:MAG: FlgD immunoglobulin-like domain containing protein, partial [bacterium]
GTNNSNDYVNEGNYTLEITARDNAGNSTTVSSTTIQLRDDQKITANLIDSVNPALENSGNNLTLKWIEGWRIPDQIIPKQATGVHQSGFTENEWFYVNFNGAIATFETEVAGESYGGYSYKVYYASCYGDVSGNEFMTLWDDAKYTTTLGKGWYRLYISVSKDYWSSQCSGHTRVNYQYRWFNQYFSSSSDLGKNWSPPPPAPTEIDKITLKDRINYFGNVNESVHEVFSGKYDHLLYHQKGIISQSVINNKTADTFIGSNPSIFHIDITQVVSICAAGYGTDHSICDENGNVLWQVKSPDATFSNPKVYSLSLIPGIYLVKNSSAIAYTIVSYISKTQTISWETPVKLTNTPSIASNPTLINDSFGNIYTAWEDSRDGNKEIYFQKVPSNFAPINGTATKLSITKIQSPIESPAAILPELLSPINSETVRTLRPTFKWTGLIGTTDYQIKLGTPSLLATPDKTFSKSVTINEANPSDGSRPTLSYSIHEFDEGLSRGDWEWQVVANPGATNEASSATEDFIIDPPLTITGVTNYPNPFNPNRQKTKIRYRLGAAADEVTIRIYDITGSLVAELDGWGDAEGSGIFEKYNDVEWDGRNGRGDLVMNGIYPFEIVARTGGTSVSARGKIAVLK